jgi:hypothetical protein
MACATNSQVAMSLRQHLTSLMHCWFIGKFQTICVCTTQFWSVKVSGMYSIHWGDSLITHCPYATELANLQNDRFSCDFSNSPFVLLCKDMLDTGTVDPCHIRHANEDSEISSNGTLSHTGCTGTHHLVNGSVLLVEFLMWKMYAQEPSLLFLGYYIVSLVLFWRYGSAKILGDHSINFLQQEK